VVLRTIDGEQMMSASLSMVREVLAAIEDRGYIPGVAHPHHAWWMQRR
jgi:hypothetical protein